MKNLFLILFVLFITTTSSFAYQQTIAAGPDNSYGTTININSYCYSIGVDVEWYDILYNDGTSNGTVQAWDQTGLIWEHHLGEGGYYGGYVAPDVYTANFTRPGRYFGTVSFYLGAYDSKATATLKWFY
nr:hypothetical protein [uncultured Draconibacterium sp.]